MQSYAQNSSYQNQLNINMLQVFAYFKKISYRRFFSIPTDYKTDNDLVIWRQNLNRAYKKISLQKMSLPHSSETQIM